MYVNIMAREICLDYRARHTLEDAWIKDTDRVHTCGTTNYMPIYALWGSACVGNAMRCAVRGYRGGHN